MTEGILILAYGKSKYIDMAVALAQSLARFSPEFPRAIVTDSNTTCLYGLFSQVIPVNWAFGSNVRQKLHVDIYTPFNRTLFIDSDSLAVSNISHIFALFREGSGCAIGTDFFLPEKDECFYADLQTVCRILRLDRIPRFNGGIYYVEKGGKTEQVFIRAREYLKDYQKYGFTDFREDGPADELLVGAAMAELGVHCERDDGTTMRTPIGISGRLHIDVVTGYAHFVKSAHPVAPAIVHFAGEWANCREYRRERNKLRILNTCRLVPKLRARLYNFTDDLLYSARRPLRSLWPHFPRPLRLAYHGITSHIDRFAERLRVSNDT